MLYNVEALNAKGGKWALKWLRIPKVQIVRVHAGALMTHLCLYTRVGEPRASYDTRPHIAHYGSVQLLRAWCVTCGQWAFLIDGRLQCCDRVPVDLDALGPSKRMTTGNPIRVRPPATVRRSILEAQHDCCFYCGRLFGSFVKNGSRLSALRIEWDHFVPFSYNQDNKEDNYVAACQFCNGLKGDRIFESPKEASDYIAHTRLEKGAA